MTNTTGKPSGTLLIEHTVSKKWKRTKLVWIVFSYRDDLVNVKFGYVIEFTVENFYVYLTGSAVLNKLKDLARLLKVNWVAPHLMHEGLRVLVFWKGVLLLFPAAMSSELYNKLCKTVNGADRLCLKFCLPKRGSSKLYRYNLR